MQAEDVGIYYDQETEVSLLVALLHHLDNKIIVDVGAEKGSFTRALLDAGAEATYAFEPFPANVDVLRASIGHEPSVHIFDVALGERDESVGLHVVEDKTGRLADAYHSLVAFEETPTLRMMGEIPVQVRTLDSLVVEDAIPAEVGILKIDTERSDFAVLRGMGPFRGDVVMLEYWDDLPETVGPAAYQVSEVAQFMAERGYTNFVLIKRHGQFETLQVNDASTRAGDWGNVVFIHDDVFPGLAPTLFALVSQAQTRLLDQAEFFATEAEKRQVVLSDLERTATERGGLLEELQRTAEERAVVITALQRALNREAGAAVTTRVEMLEEQELAIEAYLRLGRDDALWRWVEPQLGVLYQHDPVPFHAPEHYLRTVPLPAYPVISIVTPTWNAAQFLPQTLQSVLDQGYPNLEYIVQDGASNDETLRLLEEHAACLTHVNSAPDTGMAQAINRGFDHATGQIMAYLNSDDLLLPGSLHFVASYFDRHPEVDVLYGHRVLIDADTAEIGRWVLPPHEDAILSWVDYVPQETLFWRRGIWDEVGGTMDESFRFAVDWDLILRLLEAGATFARVPRFLGAFRVHADQKTSTQLADLGAQEMHRLRERQAGRPVSDGEVSRYVEAYMRRHKIYHKLYRLGVLRY